METLWQISLHSAIAAAAFLLWSRRLGLPSGLARRWMLAAVLLLPLAVAVIPGRGGDDFRQQRAWLDSERLLSLPPGGPVQVQHVLLLVAAATVGVTLMQEILPAIFELRAPRREAAGELEKRARRLPGWDRCRVSVIEGEGLVLALHGRPRRPHLLISRALLGELSDDEVEAVLWHEHAHARGRRWLATHLLFAARLLQCYNPVALWAFRELTVELELQYDREAARRAGSRPLARALLTLYDGTDPRDLATRATLRRRVEHLLGRHRLHDDAVHPVTLTVATSSLLLLLPWIV